MNGGSHHLHVGRSPAMPAGVHVDPENGGWSERYEEVAGSEDQPVSYGKAANKYSDSGSASLPIKSHQPLPLLEFLHKVVQNMPSAEGRRTLVRFKTTAFAQSGS